MYIELFAKEGFDSKEQLMVEYVSRVASHRMSEWDTALDDDAEDLALLRARACKEFCDRIRATS